MDSPTHSPLDSPIDSPATGRLSASLERVLATDGPEAVLRLARAARGPVVEATGDPVSYDVTFVFADRHRAVTDVGLFCAAVPGGFTRLGRLADGLFARTFRLPRGLRVKYHFCPDPPPAPSGQALFDLAHHPSKRQLDYLNPSVDQVHLPGLRVRILESLLTLPHALAAPAQRARPGVPAGSIVRTSIRSQELGRRKDVVIYHPAEQPAGGSMPVLLLQSSQEWQRPAFLDNLMAAPGITPFVAVLFEDRSYTAKLRDLSGIAAHTRFVVEELWPELVRGRAVPDGPASVVGYSAGGLAAAALAVDEPERFPRLGVISGALHLEPGMDLRRAGQRSDRLLERYAAAEALPGRVYLAAGAYEDIWEDAIYQQTSALAAITRRRGSLTRFDTGPTGHDTESARGYLAEGLRWLSNPA